MVDPGRAHTKARERWTERVNEQKGTEQCKSPATMHHWRTRGNVAKGFMDAKQSTNTQVYGERQTREGKNPVLPS